jgi:hypothetical protein
VTAKRQDHEITRNSSHFKVIRKYAVNDEQSDNDSTDDDAEPAQQDPVQQEVQPQRRYPLRRRKAPERLNL